MRRPTCANAEGPCLQLILIGKESSQRSIVGQRDRGRALEFEGRGTVRKNKALELLCQDSKEIRTEKYRTGCTGLGIY